MFKGAILSASLMTGIFLSLAQDIDHSSSTDPFEGLVDIVLRQKNEMDSLEILSQKEKDASLAISDLIKTLSSSHTDTHSDPANILTFVAEVYGDHDYHETGNWTKSQNWNSDILFTGKLPDYDFDDFQLPAKGKLSSLYGYRPKFGRFHHGIDLALNVGDTVRSVLPGVVTRIGFEKRGYGCYVIVSHSGGMETLYGHLKESLAIPGQMLDAGQALGLAGNTGNSTGPHLHFETRYRGVAIDPVSWFNLSGRLR